MQPRNPTPPARLPDQDIVEAAVDTVPFSEVAGGLGGRLMSGAATLAFREVLVRIFQIGGAVILARLLTPADFGVYAIVAFGVSALTVVGDLGLAPALIQQAAEPSEREYRVVFTVQMGIAIVAVLAASLVSPWVAAAFGLPSKAVIVAVSLAAAFLVSALRVVPAARLERHLQFGPLATGEVAQVVVFEAVAVAGAVAGLGYLTFGPAALAGSLANVAAVMIRAPWLPGLAWDRQLASRLLRFGLPYQGGAVVSFVKDAVNPLFLGLFVGAVVVGYVNWATQLISYPVLLVTLLSRLYFPAFARLSDRPDQMKRLAEAIARWSLVVATGLMVAYLAAGSGWTTIIFGAKWLPALPLVGWLAFSVPAAAAATVAMAALNAVGRSRETFAFAVLWMVLTWLLTVPLVAGLGWIGFGPANVGVTLTALILFRRVQSATGVSIVAEYLLATVVGIAVLLTASAVGASAASGIVDVAIVSSLAAAGFVGGRMLLHRVMAPQDDLIDDLRDLRRMGVRR